VEGKGEGGGKGGGIGGGGCLGLSGEGARPGYQATPVCVNCAFGQGKREQHEMKAVFVKRREGSRGVLTQGLSVLEKIGASSIRTKRGKKE